MSDVAMMICDWCGKEFPADANACVEGGIMASQDVDQGDEWKGVQPVSINPEDVTEEQREEMKKVMGLDDKQLDELLSTGNVEGLGSIVCIECQDKAVAEGRIDE